MDTKKLIGRQGESAAAAYLKKKKYRIIGMNYACRYGEIDLIAEDRSNIVFVEVKQRRDARFAEAREFVTAQKQARILAAARLYLAQHELDLQPRFDVIEVYGGEDGKPRIEHLEDAFGE